MHQLEVISTTLLRVDTILVSCMVCNVWLWLDLCLVHTTKITSPCYI